MASRLTNQFLYSFNPNLVLIEGSFEIGTTGAVVGGGTSGWLGRGVDQVVKNGTGQYQVGFSDTYNRFLGANIDLISPTSAAGLVTDGSFLIGSPYQIVFASTSTNWQTLGLPQGLVAAQGMPFVATSGASNGPLGSSGVTAAGNGTAVRITNTGIAAVEVLPNPNTELQGSATSGNSGSRSYLMFQTLNGSGVPTAPTSGSVIRFTAFFRNSSLVLNNELPGNY